MKNSPVQSHVLRLAHPPIPTVRIGIIGLGNRGLLTLQRYLQIEGVEIKALCEIREGNLSKAQQLLKEADRSEATGYTGVEGWKKMCESDEVDLIFICTDWLMHTQWQPFAMECNKHVAIEVPAAMSVEECWQLVDTAEKTRRHCIMLENCCYDPFALMILNMAQRGLFGEIMHVEGAYIHDLRSMYFLPKRAKAAITTIGEKDTASNIQAILIPLMGWALPARYWIFIAVTEWNISCPCLLIRQE